MNVQEALEKAAALCDERAAVFECGTDLGFEYKSVETLWYMSEGARKCASAIRNLAADLRSPHLMCEMYIDFKAVLLPDGDMVRGDEIACNKPARWVSQGVPCCDTCAEALRKDDIEVVAIEAFV